MLILEQIATDRQNARMKSNKYLSITLTTLYAEAAKTGLDDGKRKSTDNEVISTCKKFVNGVQDTIDDAEQLRLSSDEIDALVAEKELYESYIPQQMSEKDIEVFLDNEFESKDNLNIGVCMKALKEKCAGLYDGKLAKDVILAFLK